jgi:hypothetical protein
MKLVTQCSTHNLTGSAMRLMTACAVAMLLLATATSLAAGRARTYIDVHVGDMQPGAIRTFQSNGRHFVVVRTTAAMLDDLRAQTSHTWSGHPVPANGPAFFAFSSLSSGRGCLVVHAPSGAARYAPERPWQGGFYDRCHFGEWDYAGRTIRQYEDQDEAMRRPDLEALAFDIRARSTLRVAR